MEILYSDSKIAVAVKPRGVLSVDEPGGMPELVRAALGDVSAPLYTVHRLDAAVGGVMVFARTRHAAGDLSREIREGHFHKEYLAVIRGRPEPPVDTFADHMRYDRQRRMAFAAEEPGPDAREARLSFAVTVYEFYLRGFSFHSIDIYRSDAYRFTIEDGRLRPPFVAISGLGGSAAEDLVNARKSGRTFVSVDDISDACPKVSQAHLEQLKRLGALGGLPESRQVSLFDEF